MKDIVNKNIEEWSKYPFCEQTQKEINILAKDKSKLHDAFYKNLEFGTGGMRGLMGVGTNRINKYTIGKNTQGISNYLNKNINGKKSAVIAYDCRHNSVELARTVAEVFSANDIKVFLFSHLRPTPELSYAVRKLNCSCGIVLTASHNPPEYNGFKVYWQDGGQIVPPIDNLLINEIEQVNFNDINFNFKEELIEIIDTKIDNLFIDVCLKNGLNSDLKNRSSKIIFTALHGTSSTIISKLLKRAGYENAKYVESQMAPDANFSTVESPNPEEVESLDLALKLAEDENAEMIIGTDPDADRLGVAVRDLNNNLALINGNQLMVLMFDYILKRKKTAIALNKNYFIASTIVSTPMIKNIAKYYNVDYKLSLTGFKWIAKMIEDFPDQKFVVGGEESYGLMIGDDVRDKDALTASLAAFEMMSYYKENNSSVFNELVKLYVLHGFYKEKLISIVKHGQKGQEEIKSLIDSYRKNPLKFISESRVKYFCDYSTSIKRNLIDKTNEKISLPKSNVIEFESIDGFKIILRPSGTEPKIKMYISVNADLDNINEFESVNSTLENKIKEIVESIDL
ncbi:MAG: phosphoglucomutase [Flavobacteriales bacterium]|nr:MAG: phosphoglucomutase [Flavobacteriales bacterium]|tara:strand:+ start:201 stop:1907 length:1707 start_codon:yes stop_codon:yes gene_type:complete